MVMLIGPSFTGVMVLPPVGGKGLTISSTSIPVTLSEQLLPGLHVSPEPQLVKQSSVRYGPHVEEGALEFGSTHEYIVVAQSPTP